MTTFDVPAPCPEPGCPNLVVGGGRCSECRSLDRIDGRADGRVRGSARERGYGKRWERERREHLRTEPFCRYCPPGTVGRAVDHVVPHQGAEWLFRIRANWQTLCLPCHNRKSGEEGHIPIGMMYPTDLPAPKRPVDLIVSPCLRFDTPELVYAAVVDGNTLDLEQRNTRLRELLGDEGERIAVVVPSPRAGERAYWTHVLGAEPEVIGPPELDFEWWWKWYRLDLRAEESIARRAGG